MVKVCAVLMAISRMAHDRGRYPVVESYNLSLDKVPSRIEPFTSSLNLAETNLNRKCLFFRIPFLNDNSHLYCGGLIRVWDQRCWTN